MRDENVIGSISKSNLTNVALKPSYDTLLLTKTMLKHLIYELVGIHFKNKVRNLTKHDQEKKVNHLLILWYSILNKLTLLVTLFETLFVTQ